MQLQFIGAAQTVTGSMHFFSVNGKKILLDCGMFQGKRKEAFEINRRFEYFEPEEIDIVILSHAHIDHVGNLPNLVKRGFRGEIFSTLASKDLANLMLHDSAHIQQKDVEFVNKRRRRDGKVLFEPLYTQDDVTKTLSQFEGIKYRKPTEISEGITLSFFDAGHILGSAVVHLEIKNKSQNISFGFSGDLGRPNMPILKDPETMPDVDYFICESTYGGRFHSDASLTKSRLAQVIKNAFDRNGKIIVPAFSVGRTQEMVVLLHELFDKNLAPRIPIYVDSPLSSNATEIFRLHPECFDDETKDYLENNEDPFGFKQLIYITDVEESKALNEKDGPHMIISASGMAEAGRILHHLANNIENKNNIVLMVGYAAEHTLGRRIVERNSEVNIFGEPRQLNAEVVVLNSLSAHADANELLSYCNNFNKGKLKDIFLVHGDFDQQQKFKTSLHEKGFRNIHIPSRGDVFSL